MVIDGKVAADVGAAHGQSASSVAVTWRGCDADGGGVAA
jgi:hypothetical protein